MKKINRRTLLTALPLAATAHAVASKFPWPATLEIARQPTLAASGLESQLWYRQPATKWIEANPIGNGSLGAMVFGGVEQEHLSLNEDTLWSGEPRDIQNHDAIHVLSQVRQLIEDGRNTEAQALVDKNFLGPWQQSYLPLGDLFFDCSHEDAAADYRRELDLDNGIVRIRYRVGEARFTREIFASYPDRLIAIRFHCDKPHRLSLRARLESQLHFQTHGEGSRLTMSGRCPASIEPSHVTNSTNPVVWENGPAGRGMRFQAQVRAIATGGEVSADGSSLHIQRAEEVLFLFTAATSFNGFDKSPSVEGLDPATICDARLALAEKKRFTELLATHTADHRALFSRVHLKVASGVQPLSDLPIDERIRKYKPETDPALAALYFQFGRYLLIASSRVGTQPANLQGIWTDQLRADWTANWTLNCNVEINYWAAESANLSECHLPLFAMIEQLRVDGHRTARNMYGCDGWVAHHNADLWRTTSPVGGSARWAIWKMGGAWLCHHMWEHYLFTRDESFLRTAYPAMREASIFFLDHMKPEAHQWLVDYPATSFENPFRKADGMVANVCQGPAMDTQIIHALLSHTCEAAKILNQDAALCSKLEIGIGQLPPMQVSARTGMLQEWIEDWDAAEPHNGQIGQLWGLMPGSQITPQQTPDLAAALRRTIVARRPWTYSTGSWVGSWCANSFARLQDGGQAAIILHRHLSENVNPNLTANFKRADGSSEFQIDGNLGMTAAIVEMLLQSHPPDVQLLPALPPQWRDGSVSGLRARNNFEIDMEWKDATLLTATVRAQSDGPLRLRSGHAFAEVVCKAGQQYHFGPELRLRPTKRG